MESASAGFVLGYHGCDQTIAEQVFAGDAVLEVSHNDYDWLGDGVYFWEHNSLRAFDFAQAMSKRSHPSKQQIHKPAVVGAVIDLGRCLNLLDSRHISLVRDAHATLKKLLASTGQQMPRNSGGNDLVDRKLDCAVIRLLHRMYDGEFDTPFDTVRAAFFEGEKLYENAGFASKNHLQIAVRDPRSIRGYFRPLDQDGKPQKFR